MCRILVASDSFFSKIGKLNTAKVFRDLEKSMGGHGNGLYIADIDTIIRSSNMSASFAAGVAYAVSTKEPNLNGRRVIAFHTRLSSAGEIGSNNNHPIRIAGNKSVLLHNGTWGQWSKYARAFASSDTNAVAHLMSGYGTAILDHPVFANSGIWVRINSLGEKGTEILIIPRGGYTLSMYTGNGTWYIASQRLDIRDMRFSFATSFAKSTAIVRVNSDGKYSMRMGYEIPKLGEYKEFEKFIDSTSKASVKGA